MDRRHMEHFLTVLDTGSFSAAARHLGMTQPALTQSIRRLEDECGRRLFDRGAAGVSLTDAGRSFVPAAVDVLRSFDAAMSAVEGTGRHLQGMLRIVCPATLVHDPLLGVLRRLREENPHVRLEVTDPRIPAESIEAVASGAADCALFSGDVHVPQLVTQTLTQQRIVAVLPQGEDPVDASLSGLLERGLLCAPRGRTIRRILDEAVGPATVARSIVMETEHAGTITPLVRAGVGIAFLPHAVAVRAATTAGLRVVEPDPPLTRSVVLATRSEGRSPQLRAFLSFTDDV